MTTPRRPPARPESEGFVLVGVAMFVLVLTILGLSLFSLSSFESQFYDRSYRGSQAFYNATGGLDRARWALVAGNTLQSVKAFLPRYGVDYAVAVQGPDPLGPDTTGTVDWDGDDIWIRVEGYDRGSRVVLRARFHPSGPQDFYRQLITAQQVHVDLTGPLGQPTWSQLYMSGKVAQPSGSDMSWNDPSHRPPSDLDPPGRPPIDVRSSIPVPALGSYFAGHMPGASQVSPTGNQYNLDARFLLPNQVGFFTSAPQGAQWSIDENNPATINVGGTAIWLLNPGVRFAKSVTINPLSLHDRLIIVARPKDLNQTVSAIEFNGGISDGIPGVPTSGVGLILVSDGVVRIGSGPAGDQDSMVGFLSIFAPRVELSGPIPGHQAHLWHVSSLTGLPDEVIQALEDLGVLPSMSIGAAKQLAPVSGSWQELSASN